MAKKYLLYIHPEQFDAEQEKSALVNKLLTDYYGGVKPKPTKVKPKAEPKQASTKPAKKSWDKVDGVNICKKGHPYIGERCLQAECAYG